MTQPQAALSRLADNRIDWRQRVEAVRELAGILAESGDSASVERVLDRLYAFLRREPSQRPEHWYVVANEIMETVRELGLDPGGFSGEMLRLLRDPSVPEVTRDYAIQHAALWVTPAGEDQPAEDPARRDEVFRAVLGELREERNQSLDLVGTGLNSLHHALGRGEFDEPSKLREELAGFALEIASGDRPASVPSRLSALQAAAGLRPGETARLCRDFLRGEDSGLPSDLRLSAVAALGLSGAPGDLPLLAAVAEEEPGLAHAADAARKRIEERSQ